MMTRNSHFIKLFGNILYNFIYFFCSCGSVKIIEFLGDVFGTLTMRRVGLTPDNRGLTAVDYAKGAEDENLIKLVS